MHSMQAEFRMTPNASLLPKQPEVTLEVEHVAIYLSFFYSIPYTSWLCLMPNLPIFDRSLGSGLLMHSSQRLDPAQVTRGEH